MQRKKCNSLSVLRCEFGAEKKVTGHFPRLQEPVLLTTTDNWLFSETEKRIGRALNSTGYWVAVTVDDGYVNEAYWHAKSAHFEVNIYSDSHTKRFKDPVVWVSIIRRVMIADCRKQCSFDYMYISCCPCLTKQIINRKKLVTV